MKGAPPFVDLALLKEDEQIRAIAGVVACGLETGFFVDDEVKADRFIQKLGGSCRVVFRGPGPGGTVFVKVTRVLN